MQNTSRTHASKTDPPCKRQRDARNKAPTEAARRPARATSPAHPAQTNQPEHPAPSASPVCALPIHPRPTHTRRPCVYLRACGLVLLGVLGQACAPQDEPITSERIARELAASPELRREVALMVAEDRALVRAVALVVATEYREQLRGAQGPQGEAGAPGAQGERGPEGARGPQGFAASQDHQPAASYCTRLCGEGQQDEGGNVCKGGRWVSPRDLCASDEDCPQNQASPFGLRWACIEGVCERAACSTDNQCGALEVCRPYSLAPASLQSSP